MKFTYLKTTLLAAAAVTSGALASPAAAKTMNYTFAGSTGAPYCDGISLATSDKQSYAGVHLGSLTGSPACLTVNDDVGGVKSKVNGATLIEMVMTYPPYPSGFIVYIDLKQLTWNAYFSNGSSWIFNNGGVLLKGAPADTPKGAHSAMSAFHPEKASLDKPF